MLQHLFDPDALFWRILSKGVDFIGLSLIWVALCLPVVTIGPATSALYYTVVKTFRQKDTGAFGLYFKSFRSNLRIGILSTLICVPVGIVLSYGYAVMSANISTDQGVIMYVIYWIMLLIPAGMVCYLFPLIGRFEFKLGDVFRTSFAMALKHLPSTFVLVLLTLQIIIFTLEEWWPVLFAPALCALLSSLFLERIFPKYLSEEEVAVLENRPLEEEE